MSKKVKCESLVKKPAAKQAQISPGASGSKTPGTRLGVLIDWRGVTATSGGVSGRYGRSLRDGQ